MGVRGTRGTRPYLCLKEGLWAAGRGEGGGGGDRGEITAKIESFTSLLVSPFCKFIGVLSSE